MAAAGGDRVACTAGTAVAPPAPTPSALAPRPSTGLAGAGTDALMGVRMIGCWPGGSGRVRRYAAPEGGRGTQAMHYV